MPDPDSYDSTIFARRLAPHRSLDRRGFRILILVFCLCGLVSSLPFVLLGAWPVAGFMGLDVALLYLAFRVNFGAARAYEDISLTPLELLCAKVSARGARREFRFSPIYVRLEKSEIEDYGVTRLDVVTRERRVEIGGFLGPAAKSELARELGSALATARRGPRFS